MQRPRTSVWVGIVVLNGILIAHLLVIIRRGFLDFAPDITLQIAVSLGVAAGCALIALWRARAHTPLVLGNRAHNLYTFTVLGFLLTVGLTPVPPDVRAHLLHTHILLTFALSSVVIYLGLFETTNAPRHRQLWYTGGFILIILVTLVRLYGLSVYPAVEIQDESWITAWAVNWLHTGHFGDPTLLGFGDAYHGYPRFLWLFSGWIDLFGIGLWQQRVLNFLLIFPVLIFTAAAARNLYGLRAAFLSTAYLFSSAVLASAARVSHDIGVAVCVAAALWLQTEAVKWQSRRLHLVAGLIVGLGLYADYHAAGYALALLVGLYGPGMLQRRRIDIAALWYVVGALSSGLMVVMVQIISNDSAGWAILWSRLVLSGNVLSQFSAAFIGSFFNLGVFSVFELLLVAMAIIAAVRRRHQRDLMLLLVLLIGHALLAVMTTGNSRYGLIPLMPIYGVLLGGLFIGREEGRASLPFQRGHLVTFTLLLMPLLGTTTARPLQALLNRERIQATPPYAVEWLLDHVPIQNSVAGDLYYYFWLSDYPFASHLIPATLYPENQVRYPTIDAVWEAVAPVYLIIDPAFQQSYAETFAPLLATGWVTAHYLVVADFDDSVSTAVIYRRTD